ncbi:MAG TPA: hypothetical protein VN887_04845 [Candidatus Angelobacter sp.]|nr:hypothetical protein [Candidatus Angelobacter sp.]
MTYIWTLVKPNYARIFGCAMTVIGYRWALILACLLVVALLALAWHLAMQSAVQQADERGVWSAIVDYGRCRDEAFRSEPERAVEQLYIIACLPPRRTNSPGPLLWIVERERDRDIREVIAYLRTKTGKDLGDDPAKWIEKYSADKR